MNLNRIASLLCDLTPGERASCPRTPYLLPAPSSTLTKWENLMCSEQEVRLIDLVQRSLERVGLHISTIPQAAIEALKCTAVEAEDGYISSDFEVRSPDPDFSEKQEKYERDLAAYKAEADTHEQVVEAYVARCMALRKAAMEASERAEYERLAVKFGPLA